MSSLLPILLARQIGIIAAAKCRTSGVRMIYAPSPGVGTCGERTAIRVTATAKRKAVSDTAGPTQEGSVNHLWFPR